MDAIQDARDFLKDNGQDGTLRALDTALDILRASHHELKEALKEGFEQLCNPTLQGDKWRDFAANISEIISRAQLLKIPAEAVEGCADMAVVSGELPATLGNAVSDAIFEAIKRGMEVDEAVSVVVAVASDYGCNAYGEAYRRRLAELVRAHRARGEENGNE